MEMRWPVPSVRCAVDHLRFRVSRQHHRVGGAALAPTWITGQHSAICRISGGRRPWNDVRISPPPTSLRSEKLNSLRTVCLVCVIPCVSVLVKRLVIDRQTDELAQDLGMMFSTVWVEAYDTLQEGWKFAVVPCKLHHMWQLVTMNCSIWTLAALSIDRYLTSLCLLPAGWKPCYWHDRLVCGEGSM